MFDELRGITIAKAVQLSTPKRIIMPVKARGSPTAFRIFIIFSFTKPTLEGKVSSRTASSNRI
jgi:hypothetical protein